MQRLARLPTRLPPQLTRVCSALALLCAAGMATAQPSPRPQLRILLVGDSTMQARTGYGDALCAQMASQVECLNLAKGGRSTSSFRAEGRWAQVLDLLEGGGAELPTWVLIQFGHNDQPGKPGRSTDLQTEYPANLERYVQEARQHGAIPVLVTPLTRRSFQGMQLDNNLLPWADAMRKVAREQGVALIDLNAVSAQAVQAMGQQEADTLAMEPPPPVVVAQSSAATETAGVVKSTFDRTHVGPKGAQLFSRMVVDGMRTTLGLGTHIRPN